MELLETINHAPKGDISMIPQKQLSLADIFEDCKEPESVKLSCFFTGTA